ncbi:hypothetical protein IE53DRAFT_41610 [Violaceomyces palustris]|uniref:Uncharacterized protein n=1 Tax=Violaceomyces palustris TaxID=1673888 RepID=A0ACD0P0W2_9BASI|nr:hypothetical protein IE53DRAFT_41610 [Violaceomyces palustris]
MDVGVLSSPASRESHGSLLDSLPDIGGEGVLESPFHFPQPPPRVRERQLLTRPSLPLLLDTKLGTQDLGELSRRPSAPLLGSARQASLGFTSGWGWEDSSPAVSDSMSADTEMSARTSFSLGASLVSEPETLGPMTPVTPGTNPWRPKELTLVRKRLESSTGEASAAFQAASSLARGLVGLGIAASQAGERAMGSSCSVPESPATGMLASPFTGVCQSNSSGPRDLLLSGSGGPPTKRFGGQRSREASFSSAAGRETDELRSKASFHNLRSPIPVPVLPNTPTFSCAKLAPAPQAWQDAVDDASEARRVAEFEARMKERHLQELEFSQAQFHSPQAEVHPLPLSQSTSSSPPQEQSSGTHHNATRAEGYSMKRKPPPAPLDLSLSAGANPGDHAREAVVRQEALIHQESENGDGPRGTGDDGLDQPLRVSMSKNPCDSNVLRRLPEQGEGAGVRRFEEPPATAFYDFESGGSSDDEADAQQARSFHDGALPSCNVESAREGLTRTPPKGNAQFNLLIRLASPTSASLHCPGEGQDAGSEASSREPETAFEFPLDESTTSAPADKGPVHSGLGYLERQQAEGVPEEFRRTDTTPSLGSLDATGSSARPARTSFPISIVEVPPTSPPSANPYRPRPPSDLRRVQDRDGAVSPKSAAPITSPRIKSSEWAAAFSFPKTPSTARSDSSLDSNTAISTHSVTRRRESKRNAVHHSSGLASARRASSSSRRSLSFSSSVPHPEASGSRSRSSSAVDRVQHPKPKRMADLVPAQQRRRPEPSHPVDLPASAPSTTRIDENAEKFAGMVEGEGKVTPSGLSSRWSSGSEPELDHPNKSPGPKKSSRSKRVTPNGSRKNSLVGAGSLLGRDSLAGPSKINMVSHTLSSSFSGPKAFFSSLSGIKKKSISSGTSTSESSSSPGTPLTGASCEGFTFPPPPRAEFLTEYPFPTPPPSYYAQHMNLPKSGKGAAAPHPSTEAKPAKVTLTTQQLLEQARNNIWPSYQYDDGGIPGRRPIGQDLTLPHVPMLKAHPEGFYQRAYYHHQSPYDVAALERQLPGFQGPRHIFGAHSIEFPSTAHPVRDDQLHSEEVARAATKPISRVDPQPPKGLRHARTVSNLSSSSDWNRSSPDRRQLATMVVHPSPESSRPCGTHYPTCSVKEGVKTSPTVTMSSLFENSRSRLEGREF